MSITSIVIICIVVVLGLYLALFYFLRARIQRVESYIVEVFLAKVSKIPGVIEVMRPFVVDEKRAFESITDLHSQSMIHEYDTIYMLLEHNARIQDQYKFLMRLSMAIPELQKHTYFIYIRDFVISYETMMRSKFSEFNRSVRIWNRFVTIKNVTLVGYILPGVKRIEI